jgi:hypothetical protein
LYSSYWRLLEDGKWEVDSPYPVRETHIVQEQIILEVLRIPCSLWQRGWKIHIVKGVICICEHFHKMDLAPGFGCDTLIVSLRDILFLLHLTTPLVKWLTQWSWCFWFCLVALHGDVQSSRAVLQAVIASRKAILCFLSGLEGYSPGKSGMLCWHCLLLFTDWV